MQGVDRRGFIVRAIQGLGALIAGALGLPAIGYLFSPAKTTSSGGWIDVGDMARLGVRAPEEVTFRKTKLDGWKIVSEKSTAWVVKLKENEVVAYSPQCTHLGCAYTYDVDKDEFACPCHASNFSLDGRVLMGPAPRDLDRYHVKIDGSRILIGELQNPQKGA